MNSLMDSVIAYIPLPEVLAEEVIRFREEHNIKKKTMKPHISLFAFGSNTDSRKAAEAVVSDCSAPIQLLDAHIFSGGFVTIKIAQNQEIMDLQRKVIETCAPYVYTQTPSLDIKERFAKAYSPQHKDFSGLEYFLSDYSPHITIGKVPQCIQLDSYVFSGKKFTAKRVCAGIKKGGEYTYYE